MWKQIKSKSWSTMAKIYKDVCGNEHKNPLDIFVWIICSRDLSEYSVEELEAKRVCWWKVQRKYNKSNPYSRSGDCLRVAGEFLDRLNVCRPFSRQLVSITTNGVFESTYHFIVCDFTNSPQGLLGSTTTMTG